MGSRYGEFTSDRKQVERCITYLCQCWYGEQSVEKITWYLWLSLDSKSLSSSADSMLFPANWLILVSLTALDSSRFRPVNGSRPRVLLKCSVATPSNKKRSTMEIRTGTGINGWCWLPTLLLAADDRMSLLPYGAFILSDDSSLFEEMLDVFCFRERSMFIIERRQYLGTLLFDHTDVISMCIWTAHAEVHNVMRCWINCDERIALRLGLRWLCTQSK